jgi:hypothetical protein
MLILAFLQSQDYSHSDMLRPLTGNRSEKEGLF